MAKILLVEDTENNRILVMRHLDRRGHEILTAEDAEKGLALARNECPDLIIMDVGLPGMDGYDATRRLKSDASTRHIPVVALTAYAMRGDEEKALAAGCDDYEPKPIDFQSLFAKIDGLLRSRPTAAGSEK